jgi:hypothetical protein
VSAIDYSDANKQLALEPLNVELNALVERATAAAARMPRAYLGASIVGHECARQVQYDWWVLPTLPARVRLIFDRGHAFEALARAQLVQAGFRFAPPEALGFVALDGHLQGHCDGIVIAAPAMPSPYHAVPCVWECKALNAKNWRAVEKNGFAKVFPRYVVQIGLYQKFLDQLNPALVTCVNADSCEVLHLALPYDAERAQQSINHASMIIEATRAGELLPRFTNDPTNWICRFCPHNSRCWGSAT